MNEPVNGSLNGSLNGPVNEPVKGPANELVNGPKNEPVNSPGVSSEMNFPIQSQVISECLAEMMILKMVFVSKSSVS